MTRLTPVGVFAPKPLKRLTFRGVSLHRAEATVLMRRRNVLGGTRGGVMDKVIDKVIGLPSGPTAVHEEVLAGDVAAGVGGEKDYCPF